MCGPVSLHGHSTILSIIASANDTILEDQLSRTCESVRSMSDSGLFVSQRSVWYRMIGGQELREFQNYCLTRVTYSNVSAIFLLS